MITSDELVALARSAGEAILEVYRRDAPFMVEQKFDDSPLTEADRRSHELIVATLSARYPDIPIVSEEDDGASGDAPFAAEEYWLVDPLDGTKEFIKRTGEFTVNIAFVRRGIPVAGVVHAPMLGVSWVTTPDGAERREGAARMPIHVSTPVFRHALRVVASRDHAGPRIAAMLRAVPTATTLSMGSSLKFCLVAEGKADLYFRDGPTMPWDTAAAHAVLVAAGGDVFDLAGAPLRYDTPRLLNPQFIAIGDLEFPWASLLSETDTQ